MILAQLKRKAKGGNDERRSDEGTYEMEEATYFNQS